MPVAKLRALLLTGVLTGCAAQPTAAPLPAWDVSGRLNLAQTRVQVFIDGTKVVDGFLRGQDGGFDPFGRPAVFPLEGEYQGYPVDVECGQLPFTADPYCQVYVDGQLVETLKFYDQVAS